MSNPGMRLPLLLTLLKNPSIPCCLAETRDAEKFTRWGVLFSIFLFCSGCGSTSSQPEALTLDATTAAQEAFATYDTNGDKKLKARELNSSIALKRSLRQLDSNRNQAIDISELTDRLKSYSNSTGKVYVAMFISKGGRPLKEAKVVLEPEVFMSSDHARYQGTTDGFGSVIFEGIQRAEGIQPGFYKILVTSKEGSELTHGCEIAEDIPSMARLQITL